MSVYKVTETKYVFTQSAQRGSQGIQGIQGEQAYNDFTATPHVLDIIPKRDIRYWCVGSGDETTQLQAAMDWCAANQYELIVSLGNYTATNLIVPSNLTMDFVFGVITQVTGATGKLFDATSKSNITMRKPNLYGGNLSGYTLASTEGTRIGIYINACSHVTIEHPSINGFDGASIAIENLGYAPVHGESVHIVGGDAGYNYVGLDLRNRAEYCQVSDFTAIKSRIGLRCVSGNPRLSNCHFDDGVDGIQLLAGSNDSHGSAVGCASNHNSNYALLADGITNGFSFLGCHFYDGIIHIKDSTGVQILGGHLAGNTILCEGGGWNLVKDNFLNGTVSVTRGYNSTVSMVSFKNNCNASGVAQLDAPDYYIESHTVAPIAGNGSSFTAVFSAFASKLLYLCNVATLYNDSTGVGTMPIGKKMVNITVTLALQNVSAAALTATTYISINGTVLGVPTGQVILAGASTYLTMNWTGLMEAATTFAVRVSLPTGINLVAGTDNSLIAQTLN